MIAPNSVTLRTIISAPHRLGFLAGSLLALFGFMLWADEMGSRVFGGVAHAMPAMLWHGYVMIYAFFPLFMLGFIFTAGPRWLNVNNPSLRHYTPVFLGYFLGGILCIAGRWWPVLMLLGVLMHCLAWLGACGIWWHAIARSTVLDRRHAIGIGLAFCCGAIGMVAAFVWLLQAQPEAWLLAINFGIWGFLLPVFLIVSHRMIPFFSSNALAGYMAWRPMAWLYTLGGLLLLRIALQCFQLNTLIVDLPMAIGLLYTSWRWQLIKSFQVKLLAMLHAAFLWSAIGLALYVISDLLIMFGLAGLGLAPLHALTLGFFCTMLLAFVTRVTLGHSGRPLVAGGMAWVSYWLMHGVALARILGELIPRWQSVFYLLAAISALLALLSWGRVYLPMYWQARVDEPQH